MSDRDSVIYGIIQGEVPISVSHFYVPSTPFHSEDHVVVPMCPCPAQKGPKQWCDIAHLHPSCHNIRKGNSLISLIAQNYVCPPSCLTEDTKKVPVSKINPRVAGLTIDEEPKNES